MACRRIDALLSVVSFVLLAFLSSCYRPNIVQGGFQCAEAGQVCPEGFQCKSDNRCYSGDAGPPPPVCNLPTPDAGNCPIASASGSCNPVCQGCACGRCNLVKGGSALCNQTAGPKDVNEVCNPASDDCKAGLYCQPECNTPGLGRCYKFCAVGADCPGSNFCTRVAFDVDFNPTSFKICDIKPQDCDPIGQTGCPPDDDAFRCYHDLFGATYCDCKGTTAVGAKCSSSNNCLPGETCIKAGGAADALCQQLCSNLSNTCSSAQSCAANDGEFGYCS